MSKMVGLFQKADFDPETIEILAAAYEKARASLHDKGQPALVQEVIAGRIISAAKSGILDADKLCEMALTALGNKAVFE